MFMAAWVAAGMTDSYLCCYGWPGLRNKFSLNIVVSNFDGFYDLLSTQEDFKNIKKKLLKCVDY